MTRARMTRRQHGSSLGEQLILLALAALFAAVAAAAFSHSSARGFMPVGGTLVVALLILAAGMLRDRRMERRRAERCRLALEKAAGEIPAALDTVFFGTAQGGPAAFGVAAAARKLIHAREGYPQVVVTVLEFDALAAAFARPDGKQSFRIEARVNRSGHRAPQEPLFLRVPQRDEAARWVEVMRSCLGERAKMVDGESVIRDR